MLGPTSKARRGSHHNKQESTPAPPVVTVASILTNPVLLPLADITAFRLVGKDCETLNPSIVHSLLGATAASDEAERLRHCTFPLLLEVVNVDIEEADGSQRASMATTLPVYANLFEA